MILLWIFFHSLSMCKAATDFSRVEAVAFMDIVTYGCMCHSFLCIRHSFIYIILFIWKPTMCVTSNYRLKSISNEVLISTAIFLPIRLKCNMYWKKYLVWTVWGSKRSADFFFLFAIALVPFYFRLHAHFLSFSSSYSIFTNENIKGRITEQKRMKTYCKPHT